MGEVADEDSVKSSSLELWLSEEAEAVKSESQPGDGRPNFSTTFYLVRKSAFNFLSKSWQLLYNFSSKKIEKG